MSLRILADESVDYRIIKALRNKGFEVVSILEENPGIPDNDVIGHAKVNNALLLTEDSDFGEWVFVHKARNISVIFLRYKAERNIGDSLDYYNEILLFLSDALCIADCKLDLTNLMHRNFKVSTKLSAGKKPALQTRYIIACRSGFLPDTLMDT